MQTHPNTSLVRGEPEPNVMAPRLIELLDHVAAAPVNVVNLRSSGDAEPTPAPTPERWLTFEEAAEALRDQYGLHTTAGNLAKLADAGRGMPSRLNFGKRQVKLSVIIPWLRERGYIEKVA